MLVLADTPMPTPSMTVPPESVTPGFVGFAAVVVLLVVVILLILDMNRRIRRVRYREEVREELDAEQAAIDAERAARGDGGAPTAEDGRDDPRAP
ncbi:hypothetical protein [Microbacterium sp. XT11]|uniref:hypothetical protein n=1 Tax=Microbacterium sp. XT11 TaxID=367477 RepID=UPI00074307DF|nr:hypothetical protein [Microbacterium sp. XT11]ALX66576.1 hypothetical protein AB663_001829 [Microbacterium sp. XT11]